MRPKLWKSHIVRICVYVVCNLTEIFTILLPTYDHHVLLGAPVEKDVRRRFHLRLRYLRVCWPRTSAKIQTMFWMKKEKNEFFVIDGYLGSFSRFLMTKYALLYPWIFQVRVLFWPWTIMSQLYVTRSENFFLSDQNAHQTRNRETHKVFSVAPFLVGIQVLKKFFPPKKLCTKVSTTLNHELAH